MNRTTPFPETAVKQDKQNKNRKKTLLIVGAAILCAIVALLIVWRLVIIPNGKYRDAIALMKAGKYEEAVSAFETLDGYRDSANQIEECNIRLYGEAVWNQIKSIRVGDTYRFGVYEQDNDESNGAEPIEWLVLAKEGSKLLVISKYALDCRPYHASPEEVTWENSTLRQWLNSDFLDTAFSAQEQAMIPSVTVSADENPQYCTDAGNATQDKVFLLSISEAERYFASDKAKQCKPTAYAVALGAYTDRTGGKCWWWLRSPGTDRASAARVSVSGDVDERGYAVDYAFDAVRPALWIDLNP